MMGRALSVPIDVGLSKNGEEYNNIIYVIRYKILASDVHVLQSDNRSVQKCVWSSTSFSSLILFCDVLILLTTLNMLIKLDVDVI
jgi:hypothetical protein